MEKLADGERTKAMDFWEFADGTRMPMVGFGTWDVRGADGRRSVLDALDVGYRLVDTAHMYGNEREVGEALRASGVSRDDVFVTTKLDRPYAGYARAHEGVDHSLSKLGLGYVDLVLVHEPYAQSCDMWRALVEAKAAGKARHIGVSNFQGRFLADFLAWCDASGLPLPEVDQVEAHAYWTQAETRAQLASRGIAMQAWAPFTEGRRPIFDDPVLAGVAHRYDRTTAQVALRYLLQLGIAVVPKTSRRKRMAENLDVFGFSLDAADMKQIAALDGGCSLFGWYEG